MSADRGAVHQLQEKCPSSTRWQTELPIKYWQLEAFAGWWLTGSCGACDGLRRLPAQHLHHDPLSTERRQTGILVDVHPVLRRLAEASQLQRPRSGPDGQPVESPQLELLVKPFRCLFEGVSSYDELIAGLEQIIGCRTHYPPRCFSTASTSAIIRR